MLAYKKMGAAFAAALPLALSTAASAAQCQNKDAIWSAATDKARYVIYGTDGLNMFSDVTLEQWRGQKLAWRTTGNVSCSNGISVCRLGLTNSMDAPDNGTSVIIERIDENGDGVADWLALAGLENELWYAGGAKVDWFNGFGPEYDDDRQTAPDIFRLDSCRTGVSSARSALPPHMTLPPMTVGAVYAVPTLCPAFNRAGGFAAPADNDGFWWMDDKHVVGMEWECRITKRTATSIDLACSGEGETWNETRKFRTGDGWVEIDDDRLMRCMK
jgi:hypothetical protein